MKGLSVLRQKPALQSATVLDLAEGVVDGAHEWPLIPDATYQARLVRHVCIELAQFKFSPRVFLHFQIVDPGEHHGMTLYRAYRASAVMASKRGAPVINGKFRLYRRSELLLDYCRVMDVRTRPDRVSLRTMRRHVFTIRTRTVHTDGRQRPLPEALWYSVVDQIVGRETA